METKFTEQLGSEHGLTEKERSGKCKIKVHHIKFLVKLKRLCVQKSLSESSTAESKRPSVMWSMLRAPCPASRLAFGTSKPSHARPRSLALSFPTMRSREGRGGNRSFQLSRVRARSESRGAQKVTRITLTCSVILKAM